MVLVLGLYYLCLIEKYELYNNCILGVGGH